MDILLSGATGYIGRHLGRVLSPQHRLYSLTRQSIPADTNRCKWLQADLANLDANSIRTWPANMDAVVYLAQSRAYHDFPAQAEDIFNVNVRAVLNLLEYARQSGVNRFILASTANVYKLSHLPIREDFALAPESFYARSKRMAELLVESYANSFTCIVFRVFTVYGPGQTGRLIPSLIERVRRDEPIRVQGRHGFKVSPIHVADVCGALQAALEVNRPASTLTTLNLGGDEAYGVHELGLAVGRILALPARFEFVEEAEPGGWIADNSKLKQMLPLKPFVRLEEGVRQLLG